jgi:uncharacterized protein (DUF1501 family)
VGRYLDNACAGAPAVSSDPCAVHLTDSLPASFMSAEEHPTFGLEPSRHRHVEREQTRRALETLVTRTGPAENASADFLRHTLMDALVTEQKVQRMLGGYRPMSVYPESNFGNSLRSVAALVAAGLPTRVYYVSLSGFDTHSNQARQHAGLLRTLAEGLAAFQADLAAHRLDDQVLTMTFSEFGRRPSENKSGGTDHGTAAPLFVMGSKTRGGLHGTSPRLDLAANQDLTFSTDFRQVYATALEKWLGCPSNLVLGGRFAPIGII